MILSRQKSSGTFRRIHRSKKKFHRLICLFIRPPWRTFLSPFFEISTCVCMREKGEGLAMRCCRRHPPSASSLVSADEAEIDAPGGFHPCFDLEFNQQEKENV